MPASLNPRVLQNDLLVEILDNYASEIETGSYPPIALLEKLGGVTALTAAAQLQLEQRNPQNANRWRAFLELYDGSGAVKNLDAALRDAFQIPEIPGVDAALEAATIEATGGGEGKPDTEKPKAPTATREDLAIEHWLNGKGIDQIVANQLRPLIFAAISDAIDWDTLGLARSAFVGRTNRAFQSNSISFDGQTTQVHQYLAVKIRIPGELSPAAAGTALQGLLRASKNQFQWTFPDGDRMLAAFLDCVETWSRSVEDQLRAFCAPTPTWNQARAALELLCVGAAIGGRIRPDASMAQMLDAAFATWTPECASTAPAMRSLYDKLNKSRERTAGQAQAQLSSMKGGRAGAMLNPVRAASAVREIRQSKWRLELEPPQDDQSELAKLYREAKQALPGAAAAEMTVRRDWLSETEAAFGPDATRASIIAGLTAAREAVIAAGIATNNTARPLADALERFRGHNFDDSVAAARALAKQEDALAALPHFGRGRRDAVEAANVLAAAAKSFLDAVEQNLLAFGQSHEAKHAAVADSLARIDGALTSIADHLAKMAAPSAEAADAA